MLRLLLAVSVATLVHSSAVALPLSLHAVDTSCNCLYRIDVDAAGAATINQIGSGLGVGLVASMALDLNGTLYAVSNSGGGASQGQLLTIDPMTGVATAVGSAGVGSVGALAIAPVAVQGPSGMLPAGTLFATRFAGVGNDDLVTIDKSTGATSFVGPIGLVISGLAFRADGTLFGAELLATNITDRLVRIDTGNATATTVGTIQPNLDIVGALAFTPNGELLGSDAGAGGTGPKIFLVDQNNGRISNVVTFTGSFPQGLAWISGALTSVTPLSWSGVKSLYR